jgi:hypothetical protein
MKNTPNGRPIRDTGRPSERPGRPDDGNAFVPDTIGQLRPIPAADAESFAEEFIGSATGAESVSEDAEDEVVDAEEGGPFIVLDEDARLPSEPTERKAEREGHEPVKHEQSLRGANWAAKGV